MDYNILVNVKIKSTIQTNYELKQQDYGQKIIVTAEDYDINDTTARLFINKKDGTVNERIMTKDNDSYTYILDADDTSSAGKTVFDVKYYKQGVRDSSASFIFNIIPDRFGNLIESKTMSDSLQSALDRVDRTIEIVDEYDEKIEQINKASGRAENAATNSVIAVDNCEQATNKANVATDRANTAAATAEGIAENKTGVNDNAVGASTTWSSSKINTSLANQIGTANGASINLQNGYNGGLLLKELQGKSVQNGTPAPEAPVAIQSVGDNGSVVAKVTGKNLIDFSNPSFKTTGVLFEFSNDTFILNSNSKTYSRVQYDINHLRGMTVILSYASKTSSVQGSVVTIDITYSLDGVTKYAQLSSAFTIPNNASNIYLRLVANDTSVANSNILTIMKPQLELGSTSTTYEPYKEQLVTIPLTQPLRSVGSVYDRGCVKSGGLWGNDRKFGYAVFDGSSDEGWFLDSTSTTGIRRLKTLLLKNIVKKNPDSSKIVVSLVSNFYVSVTPNQSYLKTVGISVDGEGSLLIYDNRYNTDDISLFKASLQANPLIVIYELATQTFEPYPQSLQDQLNKLQTYQGVTNVFTTDALQPTLSVSYGKTDTSALALYGANVSDNKVDKSSVANNLITTVEGTVLGGEQGKILNDKIGNLSDLTTTSKTNLVSSINEVKASVDVVNNNFKYKDITIGSQTIASKGKVIVNITDQIPVGYSVISSEVIGGSQVASVIHYNSFVSYGYLNVINNDAVSLTTSVIVRVFLVNNNFISVI